jgi:signal transduction histidine kinase
MGYFSAVFGILAIFQTAQEPLNDGLNTASPDSIIHIKAEVAHTENLELLNLSSHRLWKYNPGDNMEWSDPDFDDSEWFVLSPGQDLISDLPDSLWTGYAWYRLKFSADSTLYNYPWLLNFSSIGAAEVYLDGIKIFTNGVYSSDPAKVNIGNTNQRHLPPFHLIPSDEHVIAVRFAHPKAFSYTKWFGFGEQNALFHFNASLAGTETNQNMFDRARISSRSSGAAAGVLFILILLHTFLYFRFARDKGNRYLIFILILLFVHSIISFGGVWYKSNALITQIHFLMFSIIITQFVTLLPLTLSELLKTSKMRFWGWYAMSGIPFGLFISFGPVNLYMLFIILGLISLISCTWIMVQAKGKRIPGMRYISGGFISTMVALLLVIFLMEIFQLVEFNVGVIFILVIYLGIPVGLTLFTAHNYSELVDNLEQKVTSRTEELNASLNELKSAQTQLVQQEKLASLGQLTAGIAHEIKNPLNFVNNFSDVSIEMIDEAQEEVKKVNSEFNIQNSELSDILTEIKGILKKIHEHGTRADGIVKSMLLHSRGGSGKMEPTPLNPLIEEYVNLAFHGMRAGKEPINVDIDLQLEENIGEIPLIAEDFSRVILNLCNNAFDAMRSVGSISDNSVSGGYKPKLTVRTHQVEGTVTIEIEDNGPGIPDEIKDKILQPFFTTKKGTDGTGLGLSITNDIVKAHGGKMSITTGEGFTRILIELIK